MKKIQKAAAILAFMVVASAPVMGQMDPGTTTTDIGEERTNWVPYLGLLGLLGLFGLKRHHDRTDYTRTTDVNR